MPRHTRHQKALDYLAAGRVTVLRASTVGIRLSVVGTAREPYIVRLGREPSGYLVTECSCYQGREIRPVRPKCSHIAIAELLWRE